MMKNKFVQFGLIALISGVITALFLPERTKIVVETREVIKEVEVLKEIEVIKIVEREVIKEVVKNVRKVSRKETFPDGRIVEEEIYESNEQQVARIQEKEKNRYEELLAVKKKELEESYSKTVTRTNPKRISLFIGADITNRSNLLGGFTYKLWGPITVGASASSRGTIYPMIGITF